VRNADDRRSLCECVECLGNKTGIALEQKNKFREALGRWFMTAARVKTHRPTKLNTEERASNKYW
jgi:hypothetical protein